MLWKITNDNKGVMDQGVSVIYFDYNGYRMRLYILLEDAISLRNRLIAIYIIFLIRNITEISIHIL